MWNGEKMKRLTGDSKDVFTKKGQPWNDKHYKILPEFIQKQLPMYGTTDVNTGDSNVLILPKTMAMYMFHKKEWSKVKLDEWELLGSGNYLENNINLYRKEMHKGTHTIDNFSAMYLLSEITDGQYTFH